MHNNDQTIRGTNPLNRFGKRTKCAVCESIFHWAKDCPDRNNMQQSVKVAESTDHCWVQKKQESVNMTLFSKSEDTRGKVENEIFMAESFGAAVLDTACTKTVCGIKWYEQYLDNLTEEERRQVINSESDQEFKFGDGDVFKSSQNSIIPAIIGILPAKSPPKWWNVIFHCSLVRIP
ncbi:hypothetical protein BSL78_30000 [Apostichopus japonicus]|uniref:Uncharacterized protein n=1 Tax=Stichopus japonicus TaxID=307972 RepID=A0A2G8JBR8_STIJA|nr:hypothetical protein BSL78_30000 [Apostichopus japonicus]